MPRTALLLHGFAGTGRMWDPVAERLAGARYRAHAPDLRGHGANRARPVALDAVVSDLAALLDRPAIVCGYSMGGRVALHLALAHPALVARLVLVAATAGIEDPATRDERRTSDAALARWIEEAGIEAFAERWTSGPLFADAPAHARARQREDILRNDAPGLAAALRGLGQGTLPPVWHRLPELTMPVTVVAGERDRRYVAAGGRLASAIAGARLVVVPEAGHGVPREDPAAVAAAVTAD